MKEKFVVKNNRGEYFISADKASYIGDAKHFDNYSDAVEFIEQNLEDQYEPIMSIEKIFVLGN